MLKSDAIKLGEYDRDQVAKLSELEPNILASALVACMKKRGHNVTFTPSKGQFAGQQIFDVTLEISVFDHNPHQIRVENSHNDVEEWGDFIELPTEGNEPF